MQIYDIIPDSAILTALAPEELAYSLLRVADSNLQNGSVHRDTVISIEATTGRPPHYRPQDTQDIELALVEALHWLEVNALLLPSPGSNGRNGWRFLSRRAQGLLNETRFHDYRRAVSFPKSLIHASIADRVWLALSRGDLADAVFTAFRSVEEAVREACNYEDTDIGVPMMRKAFHPDTGPLSWAINSSAERQALSDLFAGAIGSYKNPHSHRTVAMHDVQEAQEMVMLASHLLRIVENRRLLA